MTAITLKAKEDLLGRRALAFVNLCSQFSDVSIGIIHNSRMANAKSLLGVLSLHILKDEEFCVEIDRENIKVIQEIQAFFSSGEEYLSRW